MSQAEPSERAYLCALTDRTFVLPTGAPVPCLVAKSEAEEEWEPIDPALVAGGPAAVLGAAWDRVRGEAEEIGDALGEMAYHVSALAGLTPATLAAEWPGTAYASADAG